METNQTIPDFLQQYIPEGGDLKFEPNTDEELENQKNGGFGGDAGTWGDDSGGDGWGEPAAKESDTAAKESDTTAGDDAWGSGNGVGGGEEIAW